MIVAEWGQYLSKRWGRKLVQVNVRTGRSSTFADGFEHPLGLAVEPRRRPPRGRLGPRRDLPDQEALSRARERARHLLLVAAERSSAASRRFDMKPVSTSTAGTSAQLNPVRSAPLDDAEVAGAGGARRARAGAAGRRAGSGRRCRPSSRAATPARASRRRAPPESEEPSAWIRIISAAPRALQKRARSRLPPR